MINEHEGALRRLRTFWRRTLFGPSVQARIEIYEELAPTLAAGIGLREALQSTTDRHSGAKRRAVELLSDGVERDVALSETMRANPEFFTPLESALVATGERSGRMDVAFRSAAAQLERSNSTRTRFVQACTYPLVLVHCLILIPSLGMIAVPRGVLAWLAFVLPALAVLWSVILGVTSVFAAFQGSPAFARLLARVPVVGSALKAAALARFTRAFSALHGAGVTYDETLLTAGLVSGHALIAQDANVAVDALRRGEPFPTALSMMRTLPSDDLGLLISGEHSGELEQSARRVAELEEARFDVVTKRALAVLPTVLVGLVGLAVAVLAFKVIGGYYGEMNKMLNMK